MRIQRAGLETRLVIEEGDRQPDPDLVLIKLLVKARELGKAFFDADGITIKEISEREQLTPSYFTRLLRLNFLAPDIVEAILEGCHPLGLTANRLMGNTRFPGDWQAQREMLGFA